MKTREKLFVALYVLFLVFLYLLSSTDLIIKERRQEVCPVSIVADTTSDEYYVNFKKGMDQAAMEFHADVRFVTLYEENQADQQIEMLMREQQDGARALVAAAVDETRLEKALADKQISVPIVLVGTELPMDKVAAVLMTDTYEMGKTLAQKAIDENDPNVMFYVFGGKKENSKVRRFYDGITSVLEKEGRTMVRVNDTEEGETFRSTIESLVYPKSMEAVILALDPRSLETTADILAGSSVYQTYVKGLYGRGTTVKILNELDRGIIRGICVTDEFSLGYLSVRQAVAAAKNQTMQDPLILPNYYIEKADLRNPEYEKMLYPIE
ncbi:substrate-binding domain-containing protein [Brotaphodocola sp.]|uniref:substrate-binding domain-containing protein n=1 Tax=Brotaphodocola sp. TaxID=3073577 RepID=UPI003D7F0DFF